MAQFKNTPQPNRRNSHRTLRNIKILVWRWRYLFTALAVGFTITGVVNALTAHPGLNVSVLVATRPIPIGTVLSETDLTISELPLATVADWIATDIAEVVGNTTVGFLDVGRPIWLDLISTNELTRLAPSGTVIVAVRLDSAVANLLAPGDRVDLVELTAEIPTHLARSALVLPARSPIGGEGGLLGVTGSRAEQPSTIFAVTPAEAPGLAVAARLGQVSAILVG